MCDLIATIKKTYLLRVFQTINCKIIKYYNIDLIA